MRANGTHRVNYKQYSVVWYISKCSVMMYDGHQSSQKSSQWQSCYIQECQLVHPSSRVVVGVRTTSMSKHTLKSCCSQSKHDQALQAHPSIYWQGSSFYYLCPPGPARLPLTRQCSIHISIIIPHPSSTFFNVTKWPTSLVSICHTKNMIKIYGIWLMVGLFEDAK